MVTRRACLTLALCAGLAIGGCCKQKDEEPGLKVSCSRGTDELVPITSGWVYASTKTFSGHKVGNKKATTRGPAGLRRS